MGEEKVAVEEEEYEQQGGRAGVSRSKGHQEVLDCVAKASLYTCTLNLYNETHAACPETTTDKYPGLHLFELIHEVDSTHTSPLCQLFA